MFRTLHAVKFLFMGPLILVVLVVINVMTSRGRWWVQWAALGIGIAWVISLIRVLGALVVLGGLAALIAYLRKQERSPLQAPPSPGMFMPSHDCVGLP